MKNSNKIILTLMFPLVLLTDASSQSKNYLFVPNNSNFYVYGMGTKHFIIHQSRLTGYKLNKNIKQLASAKRIVNSGDDPAGLAIADKMSSLLQGLKQEAMNAEDYRNYLNYAESVIAQVQSILKRIRELILRSSNGILTKEDREMNQTEIDQLLRQINMNAEFSQFNKKKVIPELTTTGLKINKVNVVNNLYGSLELIDSALKKLRYKRTIAGVKSNVLSFQIKGKYYYYVNMLQAESRIRDLDMAEGISNLIKNNTLLKTQFGTLMLVK